MKLIADAIYTYDMTRDIAAKVWEGIFVRDGRNIKSNSKYCVIVPNFDLLTALSSSSQLCKYEADRRCYI